MYILVSVTERPGRTPYIRQVGRFDSLDVARYVMGKKKVIGRQPNGYIRSYGIRREHDWADMGNRS